MVDKIRRVDYSPAEFLEGVSNLSVDEIGLYWVGCSMMYARDGAIANDPKWIGRASGCSPRKARSLIAALLAKGKFKLDAEGRLINGRVNAVIDATHERIETARKGGEARASKIPRNRRENASNAARKSHENGGVYSDDNDLGVANHHHHHHHHHGEDSHSPHKESVSARGRNGAVSERDRGHGEGLSGWQPTADMVEAVKRARADLTDAIIASRTAEWREWVAGKPDQTRNVAKSWRWFLDRTHKPQQRPRRRSRIL
jgi:uncharacterized protein YdaU (DUF1376 family)